MSKLERWLTLVANLSVVAGIVFLAAEMRLSNRLAQAEAWRASTSEVTTLNAAFGVDPRFDQLITRVMQGEDVSSFEVG
jgi:hypothetical protein